MENHGRKLSRAYVQELSKRVGEVIERKEEEWTYELPSQVTDIQTISIGRDGTTMLIRNEGYRETMNGTISFYNKVGERVHTIYIAQAPQYGKVDFEARFSKEIEQVQAKFTDAHYIGLADGSKDNWTYLDQYVQDSILDYWHACEYISKASKAASKSTCKQKEWAKSAREKLKNEQGGAKAVLEEMQEFTKKQRLSKAAKEGLKTAITYFTNHLHQMDYHSYNEKNLPIGSGITEAACKVIVKQRTNQSGMSWDINKAQKLLNIRALVKTETRWQQFWDKVDCMGIAV